MENWGSDRETVPVVVVKGFGFKKKQKKNEEVYWCGMEEGDGRRTAGKENAGNFPTIPQSLGTATAPSIFVTVCVCAHAWIPLTVRPVLLFPLLKMRTCQQSCPVRVTARQEVLIPFRNVQERLKPYTVILCALQILSIYTVYTVHHTWSGKVGFHFDVLYPY